MAKTILGVVLALALASVGVAQSDCLFKEYDINDLADILQGAGYDSIQVLDQEKLQFTVEGFPYLLVLQDDRDLRMYCGFAGARLAFEDVNEWNRKARITKVYIDEDQDPVMVADLLADAGVNEEIVKQFVGVFVQGFGPQFQRFVKERNRAR